VIFERATIVVGLLVLLLPAFADRLFAREALPQRDIMAHARAPTTESTDERSPKLDGFQSRNLRPRILLNPFSNRCCIR
jgi:hypothetical protein